MKRRIRVLVMEDSEQWQDILLENLKGAGHQVDLAETISRAKDLLREQFYHLLILDISLSGGVGPNVDGMDLLAELEHAGLTDEVKIIMVTGYPEHMREAFQRYKVSDFIDKRSFDEQAFSAYIENLFDERAVLDEKNNLVASLKMNLDLEVIYHAPLSNCVAGFRLDDSTYVREGTSLAARVAEEIDDLLCRLFYKAECIMVMPTSDAVAETSRLVVKPIYSGGREAKAVLVSISGYRHAEKEYLNYEDHVRPFIQGENAATLITKRRTALLGGIIYDLPESAESLAREAG